MSEQENCLSVCDKEKSIKSDKDLKHQVLQLYFSEFFVVPGFVTAFGIIRLEFTKTT